MKNNYCIVLLFFLTQCTANFYDPRTWAISAWIVQLRSKIARYFLHQSQDVLPNQKNPIHQSPVVIKSSYIDGNIYTKRPINPLAPQDSDLKKKDVESPNNSINSNILNLVYAPGIDWFGKLGVEEYALSFSMRHLDEYIYHEFGCSFRIFISTSGESPLFWFSVPMEASLERLKKDFGIVLTPIRELISVFLDGSFTHGRMAISNYNAQKYQYDITGVFGANMNAVFKHYMMPFSIRPLFKEDRKLQKIIYSWILSSTIANNFDIFGIEESKRERIIADQKMLPDIYKQLFLERIKELAGQEMTQKNTSSFGNRLSMISDHIKK